jgi:hypothetical protein
VCGSSRIHPSLVRVSRPCLLNMEYIGDMSSPITARAASSPPCVALVTLRSHVLEWNRALTRRPDTIWYMHNEY